MGGMKKNGKGWQPPTRFSVTLHTRVLSPGQPDSRDRLAGSGIEGEEAPLAVLSPFSKPT